ncbi:MAG: hypothetical protein AB2L14_31710 [Candidatus Xenobiia bacterium LiM19]
MKTLHLLEAFPKDFNNIKKNIISFRPCASFELNRNGIKYKLPEDYISLNALGKFAPEYSTIFTNWLTSLDQELLKHFNIFNSLIIKPASLYGIYLQLLIDSFVFAALRLNSIFKSEIPGKVILYSADLQEKTTDYQLYMKNKSINLVLLPLFSQKYNFISEIINITNDNNTDDHYQPINLLVSIIKKVSLSLIKKYYEFSSLSNKRRSILILNFSRWTDELVRSLYHSKYRLLFDYDKKVFSEVSNEKKEINTINLNLSIFDNFVGIEISKFLEERILYFVNFICPMLEKYVKASLNYFPRNNIKAVIIPFKNDIKDFAVMAAATAAKDCLAVQVCHGAGSFDCVCWKFTESPCNIWLTSDNEEKIYFNNNIFKDSNTSIEVMPLWRSKYKKIRSVREKRKVFANKKTVLYVPTFFRGDLYRLAASNYTDTWYYEHQIKLLKYFSSEKEFLFIWKGFPTANHDRNPIPKNIESLSFDNILYVEDKLIKYLLKTDFTIHDYPSTPFYESVLSGIPTLCFYHDSFYIRDTSKTYFGNILQKFSNTDQAIDSIKTFLKSNSNYFIKEDDVLTQDDAAVLKPYINMLS